MTFYRFYDTIEEKEKAMIPSTKSLYLKWLIIYTLSSLLGGVLACLGDAFVGIVVILVSMAFVAYYAVRYGMVKNKEKKCVILEARFVSVEQTSIGWRNPKFSITVEMDVDGEKVLAKTPGVYASHHISGMAGSVITVGFIAVGEEVITL